MQLVGRFFVSLTQKHDVGVGYGKNKFDSRRCNKRFDDWKTTL